MTGLSAVEPQTLHVLRYVRCIEAQISRTRRGRANQSGQRIFWLGETVTSPRDPKSSRAESPTTRQEPIAESDGTRATLKPSPLRVVSRRINDATSRPLNSRALAAGAAAADGAAAWVRRCLSAVTPAFARAVLPAE